jgi:hypothetical protein
VFVTDEKFTTMTISTLIPGGIYRVEKEFKDCRGNVYSLGETFTYHFTSYWGYDGGIMLDCEGRRIDFLEGENADLIENFSSYVEKIGQSHAPIPQPVAQPLMGQQKWSWWEIAGAIGLVVGSIFVVATVKPQLSGAYVSAWIILALAVAWGGYALMQRRKRK